MMKNNITVLPQPLADALTSNFTGIKQNYLTGEEVVVTIDARDQFNNFINSTTDNFKLSLYGQTTLSTYPVATAISDGRGRYIAKF